MKYSTGLKTVVAALTVGAMAASESAGDPSSGFTRIEYITCTGSQYIDTGVYPGKDTRAVMTFATTDTAIDKMTFGVRNAGYNMLCWLGKKPGTIVNPCIGTSGNLGEKNTGKTSGEKWTLGFGLNGIYADSTAVLTAAQLSGYSTTAVSSKTLLLFGLSNNGTVDSRKFCGDCYDFKIYDGDKLIRHLQPGIKDDVVCMRNRAYDSSDAATGADYYYNAGTGSFLAGPVMEYITVTGSPDEFGTPVPCYGETNTLFGTNYTFNCPAAHTNAEETIAAACRGWKLTLTNGTDTTGTELTKTVTYHADTAHATLTWLWDVKYKTAFTAGTGGSVSTAGGWYAAGATVDITATPDEGYAFVNWTGDVPSGQEQSATLSFAADQPRALAAHFVALGSRYIDIITSGYAGSAPLTNFPVLVRLSTDIPGFNYTMCRADGADLVFQDLDQKVLPHEIDTWDTNGTSLVWVCVPQLTASTALRLFIGNPGASPPGYTSDGSTWAPARFRGVWHFASLSGGVTPDSSASHLDSTANKPDVSTGRVDGIVGNCVLNSDGSGADGSGWLTTNYDGLAVGDTFTVSGWCRHGSTTPTYERVFSRKTIHTGTGFEAELANGSKTSMSVRGGSSTSIAVTTPDVTQGNWYHLALAYKGTTLQTYVNGAPGADGAIATVTDNGQGLAFGNNAAKNEATYKGSFDEFRLLDAVASADWVRAEYDTVANPAFNAYSAVAALGSSLQIFGLPNNYGVADPAYGLHEGRVTDQAYTCSVSRVWTNATEDMRAACTGWKRYGIDPDTFDEDLLGTGSSNVMTYTHTDMERLEWHFARQFKILFAAGTGGTVSTNGGWYDEGSNVTVTAVADPHCTFYRWNGDVPAGREQETTLVFSALEPRSVTAQFALTYYVTTNGNDSADGRSWATAFATPHPALAVADTGDLVLISNGVFAVTNEMVIATGVTIRGVNGAARTVLRRSGSANYRLLQLSHADARVEGVTLTNGKLATASKGAGVFINGAGTLADCIVSNNFADDHSSGAGVRLDNGGLVERCRILENTTARGNGIGVYCYKGGVLRDCLIAGNRPTYPFYNTFELKYGAVYLEDGGTLQNCTVAGNDNWLCGGVYSSNSKGQLLNCIVLGNQSEFGSGPGIPDWYGTTTDWTNVCASAAAGVSPVVATAENVFRDAATGDWRLRPGSIARDAGTTSSVWTPTATDLAGQPRLQGTTVDCGALEYALQPACDLLCSQTQALGTVAITLTAFLDGLEAGETVDTCSWTFSGAVAPTSGPSTSVTCTFPPGRYTVGLTVQTSLRTLAMARTNLIHVAPPIAYVVPVTTPDHQAQTPYDSWECAATNIQDALDIGLDGTLVLVSNGTYAIRQQLKLAKGIRVRSVNGAADTTIRGASGSKCRLWYLLHPDAVVEGFTLTGANNTEFVSGGAGGGALMAYGGTLRDCTITRNTGSMKVAGLGAYLYKGGTVSRCVITNNYISRGAGTGVYLDGGGVVENCLIAYNYYINAVDSYSGGGAYLSGSAATIRSCTIIGNTNCYAGGIYETGGGHVENCIVRDNNAWHSATTEAGRDYQIKTPANALNLCTPVTVGSDCVTNAPHFVDAPRRDYRLKAGSPGWNQGLNQEWMTDALDLAGNPRIDRRLVDIGAYETPYLSGSTLFILR